MTPNEKLMREALEFAVKQFRPCRDDYIFSKRLAIDRMVTALAATEQPARQDATYAELRALAEKATVYEGYTVDEVGAVYSTSNWRGHPKRALTQHPNSHGYPFVKVKFEGRMKKALVHVMVCTAFHGPKPSPAHQVRHLNGIRSDCRKDNLAWGTPKENAADREVHGNGKSAENGRNSAWKLMGKKNQFCKRGHDKQGRTNCNQCRNEKRRAA